jgi:hypothetical protein
MGKKPRTDSIPEYESKDNQGSFSFKEMYMTMNVELSLPLYFEQMLNKVSFSSLQGE